MSWQPDGWQPPGWQPDGWQPDSSTPSPGSNAPRVARFFARWGALRRYFYARVRESMSNDSDLIFDDVEVNAGEQYDVELDLYAACVSEWRPNREFAENEYIRPRMPNGRAYQQMTAGGGLSGAKEPFWQTTIDALRADGSCIWKCVAASSNGINAISDPAGVSDPAGLTLGSPTVVSSRYITASLSGASLGTTYVVEWTFTLNGKTRKAHQRVICKVL